MLSKTRDCFALCLAMFWQVNCLQAAVITDPSSVVNVAFIGPNDPSFGGAVTNVLGPSRTPATNDWLPFSAVLTNNTSQPIVAVVVRWVKVLPDGRKGTLVLHRELLGGSRGRAVQPGQSAVVLPGWLFGRPLPSGSRDATDQPDHRTKLQTFQSATSVEVTLDGILFASGQFVGPNETQGFQQLLAEQFARSVYSEALARNASGQSAATVVNWLAGVAAQGQHLDLDPQTGIPVDSRASGMAAAAKVLMNAYSQQGASLMYRFAQAESSTLMPSSIFQ